MIGLDEIDVQIDIMSYGDIDFQTKLLTDTLDELIKSGWFQDLEITKI